MSVKRRLAPIAAVALALAVTAPGALAGGSQRGLIAPPTACHGQLAADAPASTRQRAMRCMTNFARRSVGLPPLVGLRKLDRSAERKSADILRCDSFGHSACGRGFTYWLQASGYLSARCWTVGENLAWGTGRKGTVRSIFSSWMRSPRHRRNVLSKRFRHIGIGVRAGRLGGLDRAQVWTQHFGSHCEATAARRL